jgi:hypothetical protein
MCAYIRKNNVWNTIRAEKEFSKLMGVSRGTESREGL